MEKILLSAFACDPSKGSEPGNGWEWACGLAEMGYEVHCLTRIIGKEEIGKRRKLEHLHFHFIELPLKMEKIYKKDSTGIYVYYILWQWFASRFAKKLSRVHDFKLAHHVTWGSLQMGSFLYKLRVPFIFGPGGGGQKAPPAFKRYFGEHWKVEEKRERISALMLRYNPAFGRMIRRSSLILVSNPDTMEMARKAGGKNVATILDAGLPNHFYPEQFKVKAPTNGTLKLLWVGRFLPRKGLLLLLDVMRELKDRPGITLTVVGDGEMKGIFLETVKSYGLEETVIYKGAVPHAEVKGFYQTHDAFFFTSLRDSCPAQVIEAMAYGLPCITLKLHGQAIIVNDATGVRCMCDTPENAITNLKNAIVELYDHPEKVTSMSLASYEFAQKQTWKRKIETIVNQYYPNL